MEGDPGLTPLSVGELRALATEARRVLAEGDDRQKKALLQGFVREVRVVSRDEIYPFFTVPLVRPTVGSAGATGLEPATSGVTGRSWWFRAERG